MISSLNILWIEDNDEDVEALRRWLVHNGQPFSLRAFGDAETALAFLRSAEQQQWLPRPYIILLDLYLPKMNGLAFLEELRRDPIQRQSIVFVLTNSAADVDKSTAYRHGIAGYLHKAKLGDSFEQLAVFLTAYQAIVEFPEV